MCFSGSGGQGVILASIIFAEAAIISGANAVQSQSYGPEARGGMCKAETIISKDKIGFAKSIHPDFLLALTQQAVDRFMGCTSERAIILADADLKLEVKPEENKNVVFLPIIRTAYELVGRSVTAY